MHVWQGEEGDFRFSSCFYLTLRKNSRPILAGEKTTCTAEDSTVNILLWPACITNLDALWEIKNEKQNKTPHPQKTWKPSQNEQIKEKQKKPQQNTKK